MPSFSAMIPFHSIADGGSSSDHSSVGSALQARRPIVNPTLTSWPRTALEYLAPRAAASASARVPTASARVRRWATFPLPRAPLCQGQTLPQAERAEERVGILVAEQKRDLRQLGRSVSETSLRELAASSLHQNAEALSGAYDHGVTVHPKLAVAPR
jgi:hypothetical protein